MASVHDVAAYILEKQGEMTAMKLQKLVYYSQAWSLVWDEKPLFPEKIQAWANGPVVYELYDVHRGAFKVYRWPKGSSANLTDDERATIVAVLGSYGDKSSQWLSDLTHMEAPWRDARAGPPPGAPSDREITHAAMFEYYSSLPGAIGAGGAGLRGERVVVRDFRGRALIRLVWAADGGAVYVTDEMGFAALRAGAGGLVPIGFRREDVFELEEGMQSRLGRINWQRLKPWRGTVAF